MICFSLSSDGLRVCVSVRRLCIYTSARTHTLCRSYCVQLPSLQPRVFVHSYMLFVVYSMWAGLVRFFKIGWLTSCSARQLRPFIRAIPKPRIHICRQSLITLSAGRFGVFCVHSSKTRVACTHSRVVTLILCASLRWESGEWHARRWLFVPSPPQKRPFSCDMLTHSPRVSYL